MFYYANKYFYITISELNIHRDLILVDTNECRTDDDLLKKIASKLQISDYQLKFKDLPKTELKNLTDYSHIKLIFFCNNRDINIIFPDGKNMEIKDCFKMSFDDIFEFIQNEGFICSKLCLKNNFHLYYEKKELPRKGLPLLSANKDSFLEVKMSGNFIPLEYENFKFFFSENEDQTDAESLIEESLKSKSLMNDDYYVHIRTIHGKEDYYLKSSEKYKIVVEAFYSFSQINDYRHNAYFYYDIQSTMLDMQKPLSKKLNKEYYLNVKPENLIICDNGQNEITDPKKTLISIQSLDKNFYYKIDRDRKNQIDTKSDKNSYELELKDSPKNISGHEAQSEIFNFYFNKLQRSLNLDIESPLIECEKQVRETYKIDDSKEVIFVTINENGKTEVRNKDEKMKSLITKNIFVHVIVPKVKKEKEKESTPDAGLKRVKFTNLDRKSFIELAVNNSTTISKAFEELSDKLVVKSVKPENIIIYDSEGKIIEVSEKPLRSIQSFDKQFYYEIDKYRKPEHEKIPVMFYNIKNLAYKEKIMLNDSSTVLDAVKELYIHLKEYYEHIKPENIFLYNQIRTEILDPTKILKNIPFSDYFFYEVDEKKKSSLVSQSEPASPIRSTSKEYDKEKNASPPRKFITFNFEYNGIKKTKELNAMMPFKVYTQTIKDEFSIDEKEDVLFTYTTKHGNDIAIENFEDKMDLFKDGIIKVYLTKNIKNKNESKETQVDDGKEENIDDETGKPFVIFHNPYYKKLCMKLYIDNTTTVLDAVKLLNEKLKKLIKEIKTENIFVFDKDEKPIKEPNKPLISIQNLNEKFYYIINTEKRSTFVSSSDEKSSPKKVPSPKKQIEFSFEYNGKMYNYNSPPSIDINKIESSIRKSFKIDPKETVIFTYVPNEGTERLIENKNETVDSFADGFVRVSLKPKVSQLTIKFTEYIKGTSEIEIKVTIMPTVPKALEMLASKLGVKPENLILYSNLFDDITSSKQYLSEIQKLSSTFYYEIKKIEKVSPKRASSVSSEVPGQVRIVIVFEEESFGKKFYPMRLNVPPSMTLYDVQNQITDKNDIFDPIVIKYKSETGLVPLDLSSTISDIEDKIKEKNLNGRSTNYIYVGLKSKMIEERSPHEEDKPKSEDGYGESYSPYRYGKSHKRSPKLSPAASDKPDPIRKPKDGSFDSSGYRSPYKTKEADEKGANDAGKPDSIATVKPPRRNRSLSAYKPKTKAIEPSPEKEKPISIYSIFEFEYNYEYYKLKCKNASSLDSNENSIRNKLGIDVIDKIEFTFDEKVVKDLGKPMKFFKDGVIHVSVVSKKEVKPFLKPRNNSKSKYAPKDEPESSPESKPKPKPKLKPKPKPVIKPAGGSSAESSPESKPKPKPKPRVSHTSGSSAESSPESKPKPNPKPRVSPTSGSSAESSPESKPKPVVKHAGGSSAESSPKSKPKPPIKSDSDSEPKSKPKPEPKSKTSRDSGKKMTKYVYQILNDDEDHEIELDSEATVKTLKEKVSEEKGISNPSILKVIFAGKELLDDILLEPMEIGDIKLFIYCPPVEEVLLMTAKALKFDNYDDYDDDDDNNNDDDDDDDDDDLY